ncbi:MAG: hypothetical protein EBU23_15505 [Mycobacteriaceae bacterium]|nr:hypothetical protein [Mycobacteriaceae bacterium]
MLDLPELEREVAASVTHAWRAFREGDVVSAAKRVGDIPESDIFVVPPARSRSSRWARIILGAQIVLVLVFTFRSWRDDQLRMVRGRSLNPVDLTEAEVRGALAQLEESGTRGSNVVQQLQSRLGLISILPDQALFTLNQR